MIIAVNTRFLLKDRLEGYGYFTQEVLRNITVQHPEHQFYFLFDRPYNTRFIFAPNVVPVIIAPPARHPLLWKYWYDIKLPFVLKKLKADVFVSPDGFCSLATRVPQCLVVHDLGFLHQPHSYLKSHLLYYKQYTPKFLNKARRIATVSQFSKDDIAATYNIPPSKIDVVYSAAKDSFQPVAPEQKRRIKEKYTDEKEYFICVGALQPRKNLVNLLKAFSIFKKRQRSNMKLVLAGRAAWKGDAFTQSLQLYKYRKDVVLTGYVEEEDLVNLIGGAYALVYPSLFEGFGVPVLEGMQCGVPVLTSAATSMQEIGKEAALYFDPADPSAIAEQLMLIYKDEGLRSGLIQRGTETAKRYSWQQTADLLWQSILKAAETK